MTRYTLTVVDTTGIQDYIFGTNNLRQNVGASYLIDCATRQWAVEALPNPHNVLDLDGDPSFTDQAIEDGELKAEVIYAGGGNIVILFAGRDLAVNFARRLTRQVLLEAPGLQIVLMHQDFDWQSQALGGESGVGKRTMDSLAARKASRSQSWPMLGLGVTAACTFTGLPAVGEDDEGRLIAAEVKAKTQVEPRAHERLKKLVQFPKEYQIPKDFDDFGRTKEESSYIAVTHTDGNGMGKRIQQLRDQYSTPDKNREYIGSMRAFSLSVQRAALDALQSTMNKLVESVQVADGKKIIGEVIELQDSKLPFRPIVFGGDDLTFVCDGRLGLALAAYYLEQFSSTVLADGKPAHCRAGVAVVKTHYPFARAYVLANDLCQSAKKYINQRQQPPFNEDGLTAMDWHFATSGLLFGAKETREKEYDVPNEGELLIRPVRLTSPANDWRSWHTFRQVVRAFQTSEQWAERHNKVKALREALRAGRDAVKHFRTVHNLDKLPSIPHQPEMEIQGWQGDRCGYFDAIEAMDFFVPLAGEQR